ncbi:hypothetical protein A2U01_0107323, partial [Trifolium medium]|nr:hypothetical protein [Trifolium medium]
MGQIPCSGLTRGEEGVLCVCGLGVYLTWRRTNQ